MFRPRRPRAACRTWAARWRASSRARARAGALPGGSYITSLEMAGASLTLLELDEEFTGLVGLRSTPPRRVGEHGQVIAGAAARATTIDVWMSEIAEAVKDQRDYLTQLDAAVGDGDHGVDVDGGFDAVGKALAGQEGNVPPGRPLILAGKTLASTVGERAARCGEPRVAARAARSGTGRNWASAACSGRSGRGSTESWSSVRRSLTRRWWTHSVRLSRRSRAPRRGRAPRERARCRVGRGGGGREGDRPAPGPQGRRVLSRRALHRPPGPGRNLRGSGRARAAARAEDRKQVEQLARTPPIRRRSPIALPAASTARNGIEGDSLGYD
jgi:hypothetical protein